MPPIPETELEQLKGEISVQGLAETRGGALARKGADLAGLWPLHEDYEPSLAITPGNNLWPCL